MSESARPTEVVYERPAPQGRRGAVVAGAALFVVTVLWVTLRALPGPAWFAVAVAIPLAVLAAQLAAGGAGPLATRRVTVERGDTLRIEHRRGARAVALADVVDAAHGVVTGGDGVALDAVTVTLRDGSTVVFGVAGASAAEGAARAIRALLDAREPAPEGDAQSP